jgi:hypothetical protein
MKLIKVFLGMARISVSQIGFLAVSPEKKKKWFWQNGRNG